MNGLSHFWSFLAEQVNSTHTTYHVSMREQTCRLGLIILLLMSLSGCTLFGASLLLEEQSCQYVSASSCYQLGLRYLEGNSVKKSDQQALKYFLLGCDGRNAAACYQAGQLYEKLGSKKDLTNAVESYTKGCNDQSSDACFRLGQLYQQGKLVTVDQTKARDYYKLACQYEQLVGCVNLGWLYQQGILGKTDFSQAYRLYRRACDGNNTLGCYQLGRLYDLGEGVPVDPIQAANLYQQACPAVADACYQLGVQYDEGKGRDPDVKKATEYFTLGCDKHSGIACYTLALRVPAGQWLKRLNLLNQACEEHFAKACLTLGNDYYHGNGIQVNLQESYSFYQKACQLTNYQGCYRQAEGLRKGEGVKASPVQANTLYQHACDHKINAACYQLAVNKFAAPTTTEKIAEAVELLDGLCRDDVAQACYDLAQRYQTGQDVLQNGAQAQAYFQLACDGQIAEACFQLGPLMEDDYDPENQVANQYLRACTLGSAEGCYRLGEHYRIGSGVNKNRDLALQEYQKACDGKYYQGCYWQGRLLELTPTQLDAKTIAKMQQIYQTACDNGIRLACYRLGTIKQDSRWGKVDPPAAAQYFRNACSKDEWLTCYPLAALLLTGNGVVKSVSQAAEFYQQVCDSPATNPTHSLVQLAKNVVVSGNWSAQACFKLGLLYQQGKDAEGDGVDKNPKMAASLFNKSCQLQWGEGCYLLAIAQDYGRGLQQNNQQALTNYERACNESYDPVGEACYNLGVSYRDGIGTKANPSLAQEMFKKSCLLGQARGCFNLALSYRGQQQAKHYFAQACQLGLTTACKLVDGDASGYIVTTETGKL
ncbi:tetratricopeptide repeat protein [Spartinivicinus ruber]|uniref:tetratricopeptide repeat protein n=1 Tax=Spartinivicinus ruber TaxID=2683272 RepID=UPI0013D2775C|nr:SEL1-like repeat protein [Spartinivicinus ruber]